MLIGGVDKLILNAIDLTVDLLALLASLAVLLLERFPRGKLLFQAQLAVILALLRPFLISVQSFLGNLDGFVAHIGGGGGDRRDGVVDTDGHALADVLTQFNELAGGRMAVQRLLRGVERGKTEITARAGGVAQLRADTIDKALRNVSSRVVEFALIVVHLRHDDDKHGAHRRLDRTAVLADRGAEADHHLYHRRIHRRGVRLHACGDRRHQLRHCHDNNGLVLPDARPRGAKHVGDGFRHVAPAVVESIGEALDAASGEHRERICEVHERILVHVLQDLGERRELFHLRDRGGKLCNVDVLHRLGIVGKALAEDHELFSKVGNIIAPRKEAHKPAAIRDRVCKLRESLARRSGVIDGVRVQSPDCKRVVLYTLSERNKFGGKTGKGRPARQPRGKPLQQLRARQQDDRAGQRLYAREHIGRDAACAVNKRLCVCHERREIASDPRELAGNAAHKSADDTADKSADRRSDVLQQLSALADQPRKARELCKRADCRQHERKFRNERTHTEHAGHCAWDQGGDRSERHKDARKQSDTRDGLHQYAGIKPRQRVNDAGEERRDHIDRGLNKLRQPLGNAVQQMDKEQHDRIDNLRRVACQRGEHRRKKRQRALRNGGNALCQHVDEGQYDRLERFSERRSAVRDHLTECHDRLAELCRNSGDQRGNARDDRGKPRHNDRYARAHRSRKRRDAYRDGAQAGACSEKSRSDGGDAYADERKRGGKREDRRHQRCEQSARNADHRKRARKRDKPLCDPADAHGAEREQDRGEHRQRARRDKKRRGARQCAVHHGERDRKLSEGDAHCDKALRDRASFHPSKLGEDVHHDLKRRADGDQPHADTDHVLRHHVRCYGDLPKSHAHRGKALAELLFVQISEVLHGGGKYLHGHADLHQRKPRRNDAVRVPGEPRKGDQFGKHDADGRKPALELFRVHLREVVAGGRQHLDRRSEDHDAGRGRHGLSAEFRGIHKYGDLRKQHAHAGQPDFQAVPVKRREFSADRGKDLDGRRENDHLRGPLHRRAAAGAEKLYRADHTRHQSRYAGNALGKLSAVKLRDLLQRGGEDQHRGGHGEHHRGITQRAL